MWWRQNDTVRQTGELQADSELFRAFALEIIRTANPDATNERLMAAVAREIGDFDEAVRLLTAKFPEDYAPAVTKIRNLARVEDRLVRQL